RTRSVPASSADRRVRADAHRDPECRGPGRGSGARDWGRCRRISHQALLSTRAAHPRPFARAGGGHMAGEVALCQALSYARDLKSAYEAACVRERELGHANERLRKGYQQSLQYAQDLKKTYARLQRAIFQSLLGLANALEAKDPYTRGHSTRVAELAGQ